MKPGINPVWMGIVNLTPDSFSDGSLFNCKESALKRSLELIRHGAHILDFGGVSTRPAGIYQNVKTIAQEEELERVYDVIKFVKSEIPENILISIDTYTPYVAQTLAQENLIDIINDINAGREMSWCDANITTADIAAKYELGYIMMHMPNPLHSMHKKMICETCTEEVYTFFKERIVFAQKCGVQFIVVDPGIGFGKSVAHNLELLSETALKRISELDKHILIGLSRKSFLAQLYPDLTTPQSRDKVTKKFELECVKYTLKNCIIRTHVLPGESHGSK